MKILTPAIIISFLLLFPGCDPREDADACGLDPDCIEETDDAGSSDDCKELPADEEVIELQDEPVLQDVVACVIDDIIRFTVATEWEAPPAGGTVRLIVSGTGNEAGESFAMAAEYNSAAGTGELRVLDLSTFTQIETQPTEGSADTESISVHQPYVVNGDTLSAVVNGRSFEYLNLAVTISILDADGGEISKLQLPVDIPALVSALSL